MRRTRDLLGFGLALSLALLTAVGLGAWRSHRNDIRPSATLRPGQTIEFRGSEFSLESFGHYGMPSDVDLSGVPAGAEFIRLVLTQRVQTVPDEPYDLACRLDLHNGSDRWPVDSSLSFELGLHSECHENADDEPLAAGETNTITALWRVPPMELDQARVVVQFNVPDLAAFEVRPAG